MAAGRCVGVGILLDCSDPRGRTTSSVNPSGSQFERYQRSEKALAEVYVQSVSRRRSNKSAKTLIGHSFSASSISQINETLDAGLKAFCERRLKTVPSFSTRATRKVRETGVMPSGVDRDWRRPGRQTAGPRSRSGQRRE